MCVSYRDLPVGVRSAERSTVLSRAPSTTITVTVTSLPSLTSTDVASTPTVITVGRGGEIRGPDIKNNIARLN